MSNPNVIKPGQVIKLG
ncbi:hypothetical protein OL548_14145 [Lysinibacillus sp. MHQ-1]|nr:hypothetical protein OL548_14145 [Lysinibacillus sp. MHQ-1]